MSKSIGIGLAGFGTVGAGVYKNLAANGDLLAQRLGARFEVRRIAVRDLGKPRNVAAPIELFTANADDLVADSTIRIVVELMGGIETPLAFVKKAIKAERPSSRATKPCLPSMGRRFFISLASTACRCFTKPQWRGVFRSSRSFANHLLAIDSRAFTAF